MEKALWSHRVYLWCVWKRTHCSPAARVPVMPRPCVCWGAAPCPNAARRVAEAKERVAGVRERSRCRAAGMGGRVAGARGMDQSS